MSLRSTPALFLLCFMSVHSTSLPSKALIEGQTDDKDMAISISLVRAHWDGENATAVPNLGYDGNANFRLDSVSASRYLLTLPFATSYEKEPAFCKWQFEGRKYANEVYYYRMRAYKNKVTVRLYKYDSKSKAAETVNWSSIETDFSVICFGGGPFRR